MVMIPPFLKSVAVYICQSYHKIEMTHFYGRQCMFQYVVSAAFYTAWPCR